MPNAPAHKALTVAGALGSLALVQAPGELAITAGWLSGLLIDPDLDLEGWTGAELRLRGLWEPLGWAWFVFWWPYAKVAKHRGLSHAPILGTAARAAYVLIPVLGVLALLGASPPWRTIWLWFLGLAGSDLIHIIADVVWTATKKAWRRWLRGKR